MIDRIDVHFDDFNDWWEWWVFDATGEPIRFGIGFDTREDAITSLRNWMDKQGLELNDELGQLFLDYQQMGHNLMQSFVAGDSPFHNMTFDIGGKRYRLDTSNYNTKIDEVNNE